MPATAKPAKIAAVKPPPSAKPRSVSWWADVCRPEQREEFAAAARQRDQDGKYDPVWQRPENFQQLGAKANS